MVSQKKMKTFSMITNWDFYFSSTCNLDCTYCCMGEDNINNHDIVKSIEDKSFQQKAIKVIDKNTVSIGLWGMEPAINAKYFADFVAPILQRYDNIKYIYFSTNGTIPIFNDVIIPLNYITHKLKHKLVLTIQISLDGPEFIQDRHCGIGNYKLVTENLNNLLLKTASLMSKSEFLRVKFNNKSTIVAQDFNTNPRTWKENMDALNSLYESYHSQTFICKLNNLPTLEYPGNYTRQDGLNVRKWKKYLDLRPEAICNCSAGTQSKTMDYLGNVYDCHLLKNMPPINLELRHSDFNRKAQELINAHEIIPNTDINKLWAQCNSIHCWSLCGNLIPISVIKLFGNGMLMKE